MQRFYEVVVRAKVKDGHDEAMLELRPRFVQAMCAALPGLLDAHVVPFDDGSWLDIVSWESLEAATGAEEAHAVVLEATEMDAHIAEVA